MRSDGIAVGDRSHGIAVGDRSHGIAVGDRSHSIAVGDRSHGIAVGMMVVALCLASEMASADLLAHWPLDEIKEGIVADASGHGHDAIAHGLEGRLPQVVSAITPHGLQFVGKDEQYLEVRNTEGLAAPAAFTVMAWIKPRARNGTYEIIGNKGDRSGDPPWPGWRLRYFWTRPAFDYGSADGSQTRVDGPEWCLPAGLWSHVAATYDGQTVTLWVDAEKVAEQAVTQPIMPAARPLVIGNYIGRKNAYALDGVLDEVRVFAGVLSAEEIFAAAAQGMP